MEERYLGGLIIPRSRFNSGPRNILIFAFAGVAQWQSGRFISVRSQVRSLPSAYFHMLSYNELKSGTFIILDGQPHEVLVFEFLRMQQRKPVAKTKLKNLITGKVKEQTFHQSDVIDEAEVEKMESRFLYETRGIYWFDEAGNPKNRFFFKKEEVGNSADFLKPNMQAVALKFKDKIINIELPIKADYKVIEAPPAIKGDTAQGGNKTIIIEGGAKINVPLFINEGDIIKVNTQTGEYVERVEKS